MDGDNIKERIKPVDLCQMTPYKRQRTRDAWLSEPKSVKAPPFPPHPVQKTSLGNSVPALKAKCSPHTELLAMAKLPLPKIHYVTKAERELQKELEEQMTREELRWLYRKTYPVVPSGVSRGALNAKATPRIEAMALAKLSLLHETKKRFFSYLQATQKKALNRHIKEQLEIFKTNYPPEADTVYVISGGAFIHANCTGKQPEKGKRTRCICELNKNQRKIFRRRMKILGQPKKLVVQDKGPDRGPKKRIKDFEPWLSLMSQPRPLPRLKTASSKAKPSS